MAARGDSIIRYIYTGADGERIPADATKVFVLNTKVIRSRAFLEHPNIVELVCHENVEEIEERPFEYCPFLRRVIMPGVKIVGKSAFFGCDALTDIECGKLEIIREWAFGRCRNSLRHINLPSARIVEASAFYDCYVLRDVKFGSRLERVDHIVFANCSRLERITIPLKDDIITIDNTFQACFKLKHVNLVEGPAHEFIDALELEMEDWRNDIAEEIDSIDEILSTARAGTCCGYDVEEDMVVHGVPGEKAWAIQRWIRSVLFKLIRCQAEHQLQLSNAAATLQFALPRDIVMNNVLSFLYLPHTFELEDWEDEDSELEEFDYSSQGEDSEEDGDEEGGGEDEYLEEERNHSSFVGRNEDNEEYDQDETAQRGRDKRQRR